MDWTESLLEILDLRSFASIWFWIAVAVFWSTASHWVLGVPFDMVARARRRGGQAQIDLETIVAINVKRVFYIMDVSGAAIVAIVSFVLTGLALMGFWYGIEFCQALALLFGPMSLVGLFMVRLARRIREGQIAPADLPAALSRQRMITQFIGLMAIFATAFWGMLYNLGGGLL